MAAHFEVEIDLNGESVNPAQTDNVIQHLAGQPATAVLVMSHGWNNSIDDARNLYRQFFGLMNPAIDGSVTIGIFWPSMKYVEASQIPGGAAALTDMAELRQELEQEMASLAAQPADEEGAQALASMPRSDLLDLVAGTRAAARKFLNTLTYYRMRARAGLVGQNGVCRLIDRIQGATALPIHLIGHSFGGRVVTSAASRTAKRVSSLTLLQAAFSHHAFSPDYDSSHSPGAFRNVIHPGTVDGPILVSHSIRDLDVGIAYAVASRIARQNANFIGDASDPYGGLGRNGAQKTPEAVDGELGPTTHRYSFGSGAIWNLRADDTIMGHSDIVKPEIANAVLQAVRLA